MHNGDCHAGTITYCGGGILASATVFIMNQPGFTNVAVYTTPQQDWVIDSTDPMDVEPPGF